jgi:hypothetical protein
MKHLFKPHIVKGLWVVLIIMLVVKMAWFLVEVLWLPAVGVQHLDEKGPKALSLCVA